MLLDQQRRGGCGRIAVISRNETFGRLLRAILDEWYYDVGCDGTGCDLVLVERGLDAPADAGRIVWLSPMPLGAEPHLELPLSLVELYHYLEQLFFPVPRRHIRLRLNQPVDINVRDMWLVGTILSLSDRGARVACPAMLPRGEPLTLDFKLGWYPLRLTGEVIYDVPAGDGQGKELPQAGLMLRSVRPSLRKALRNFIQRSYVERACAQIGTGFDNPSMSWFDLADNPWADLSG
jgi:hypothetical protein